MELRIKHAQLEGRNEILEYDNQKLEEKVEHLEKELELVHWIVEVLEDIKNMKEQAELYIGLKRTHLKLRDKYEDMKVTLNKKLAKANKTQDEALSKLK